MTQPFWKLPLRVDETASALFVVDADSRVVVDADRHGEFGVHPSYAEYEEIARRINQHDELMDALGRFQQDSDAYQKGREDKRNEILQELWKWVIPDSDTREEIKGDNRRCSWLTTIANGGDFYRMIMGNDAPSKDADPIRPYDEVKAKLVAAQALVAALTKDCDRYLGIIVRAVDAFQNVTSDAQCVAVMRQILAEALGVRTESTRLSGGADSGGG